VLAFFWGRGIVCGMAEHEPKTRLEIDASKGKFEVEGDAWDAILPAVKPGVSLLGNLLGIAANATGLTAEIFNDVIDNLRKMYREGVLGIPPEHRRRPPFRIAADVLEETVKCVEEPELHKMFANLLIAASDDRRQAEAHPGFAKAISQLTPLDAKIIAELRTGGISEWTAEQNDICSREDFEISQANLIQLGIAEWLTHSFDGFFIANSLDKFDRVNVKIPRQTAAPNHWSSSMEHGKPEGLREAARDLVDKLKVEIQKTQKPLGIKLSEYGKLFAKACLDPLPAETSASPPATPPSP
jgi:hypothetical protein